MKRLRLSLILIVLLLLVGLLLYMTHWTTPALGLVRGKKTVEQRLEEYGPGARQRMRNAFARAHVVYPPSRIVLLAIKDEMRLELYAPRLEGNELVGVTTYAILAASGQPGPKLRRGDRQVPEGIYAVESLNPNSRFHLSLRLDYPNLFDRDRAASDGRVDLGGDIMIHGKAVSVGCLAMGDEAVEELFVLAADCGIANVRVVIVPTDFRRSGAAPPVSPHAPGWVATLYDQLAEELSSLPRSR